MAAGLVPAGAVEVQMEGGNLAVSVATDGRVVLRGPVEEICEGELAAEFVARLRV